MDSVYLATRPPAHSLAFHTDNRKLGDIILKTKPKKLRVAKKRSTLESLVFITGNLHCTQPGSSCPCKSLWCCSARLFRDRQRLIHSVATQTHRSMPERKELYPEKPRQICQWLHPAWAASWQCWLWCGHLPLCLRSTGREQQQVQCHGIYLVQIVPS